MIGWALVVVGIALVVMSESIVFPGLELLLGIEAIVGRESVIYEPDGSYIFTNPSAMIRWVASVAGFGLVLASLGFVLLYRTRPKKVV